MAHFRTPKLREAWEFIRAHGGTSARFYAKTLYGSEERHLIFKTSYALQQLWKGGWCVRRREKQWYVYSLHAFEGFRWE